MNSDEFQSSLGASQPPSGLTDALCALWWDIKGDWDRAHSCVEEAVSGSEAWVHAYLHRKEGDQDNAGYWYRRAGRSPSTASLDTERKRILETLLKQDSDAS